MKKYIAIFLCIICLLQFTACKPAGQGSGAKKEPGSQASKGLATGTINSFEDFTQRLDEEFEIIETQAPDGTMGAELVKPEEEPIGPVVKDPVIPSVDTVTPDPDTPETNDPEPETPVTPEPDTPGTIEPTPPSQEEPGVSPGNPGTGTTTPEKPTYTYTTGQTHRELPYTQRYLYNTLNSKQKEWYRKIDVAVKNLADKVELDRSIEDGKNYYIYFLYMLDNPEHFYLTNTVGYYTSGNNGGLILGYSDGTLVSGFEIGDATQALRDGIRAKQAKFNAAVEKIISTIPADAPDVWKELLIYDRLIIDSHYNTNAQYKEMADDDWSAYGVLIHKTGVCESYTEAFQLLCLKVGIKCTGIMGYAGGGGHKWNAVELDGQWYACDITFDDPIGGKEGQTRHAYFNLTSAQMTELEHTPDTSDCPIPNCTGTKYSYANYFSK